MDYYVWSDDRYDDAFAWISDRPEAFGSEGFRLNEGIPCADWFPKDLVFDLSRQYGGVKLPDHFPNTLSLRVVSGKLKKMLEELAPETRIEFLPVQVRNRRKKLEAAPYFVANVLDVIPCTDMKKSEYWKNTIVKDQIQRFKRLVLDERKIPKGKKLFRLGEMKSLLLAHRDLGQAIVDADCTGVFFMDVEEYGKEFR
jgi:hypothetical protein